ncbi:MAG: PAS domain S-box protein, partial [Bacteroidia bacterium]|nr:PAS domain S-box protein [Bacteroidia bacterium]
MSEMILESTLDSLPGIFYMLDNKGFLVKWNRKFEEVSGYTGKELAGMNALDLFRGSNKELIAARIGEVFKKGSSDAEADFVSKDGTATPYYFSGEAVKTDGVIYLFGMGFNISDRKQVEASLLESEEQFRTIFEKSPIGIELYDASGIQVAANKTSCDMFGIKDDSSKGFNLFSGTSLTEELKQQLRTGIPIAYQTTFDFNKVRELGQYRTWRSGKADMDYRITPLTSREKEGSLGYLVQVQEITERRNNERIQRVLYNISNAVITTRDLEELLEIIHAQLGLLVDANNFYVAFYDEQSDILNSPYSKDQKDEINSWPAARSITGHVIYTNESLLATKTEVLEMISSGVIEMIGIPSESWLGVPLRSDGKAIGALVVQSYDNPQAYKAEDLQILEFISAQVSLSIQRKQADISLRESEERF